MLFVHPISFVHILSLRQIPARTGNVRLGLVPWTLLVISLRSPENVTTTTAVKVSLGTSACPGVSFTRQSVEHLPRVVFMLVRNRAVV